MNQDLFWELFDANQLEYKVFEGNDGNIKIEVTAFEYEGKFYLRITKEYDGESWYSEVDHRMKHTRGWINSNIKEFETKSHANNYFKKIGNSLKRVR